MTLSAAFIALLALLEPANAAYASPKTTVSYINNLPSKVHYFPDTSNVLFQMKSYDPKRRRNYDTVHLRSQNGQNERVIEGLDHEKSYGIVPHPFDKHMMFVKGSNQTAYRTTDGGNTWTSIHLPVLSNHSQLAFNFHLDCKRAIISGAACDPNAQSIDGGCSNFQSRIFYTSDISLETPIWKTLPTNLTQCIFAYSSDTFRPASTVSTDHIFCRKGTPSFKVTSSDIIGYLRFLNSKNGTLVQSSTYFRDGEMQEPFQRSADLHLGSVTNVGAFLVASFEEYHVNKLSQKHFYVTRDGKLWEKVTLPNRTRSTSELDIFREETLFATFTSALGLYDGNVDNGTSLYRSDHNGTIFTKVLDNLKFQRPFQARQDEELRGIPEFRMKNVVHQDFGDTDMMFGSAGSAPIGPSTRTLLSVDDGLTWGPIQHPSACEGWDGCSLHFHDKLSVQGGRGYRDSNPSNIAVDSGTPGYVIGVGCTGTRLCDYDSAATYLSRNAGIENWDMIFPAPTMHAMGLNGDIMVLAYDSDFVNHVVYSLDGGVNWLALELDLGFSIKPKILMSSPGSDQMFTLIGSLRDIDKKVPGRDHHVLVSIDFANVLNKSCTARDHEGWSIRDTNGNQCVMGRKTRYRRRKLGSTCFSKSNVPVVENCACKEEDYECDTGFNRRNGNCVPTTPPVTSSTVCSSGGPNELFEESSGYRKIAGNTCQGGLEKDKRIVRKCHDDKIRVASAILRQPGDQVVFQHAVLSLDSEGA